MGDGTTLRSFRLTDEDIENIDRVVRSGDATNATDAVRLALHEYVSRAAERESIGHRLESLDDRTPPNPMGGYAVEQLIELLKTDAVDHMAAEELLRRRYFPDSRGNWIERPVTSLKVDPEQLVVVAPGATRKFYALDQDGARVPDVEWDLTPRTMGKIDSNGVFSSGNAFPRGIAGRIHARRGGLEAHSEIHVWPQRSA